MKGNYYIESGADPQQVIQLLEDKIYDYNSAQIDRNDGQLFCKVVRDENNNIVAGIAGWTWADACEITQLWVDEKVSKKGIGEMLLEVAEEEAKSKGCIVILVKTYSFQAPLFYEKHGYKTAYVINEFPKGHHYYALTKTLTRT